MLQLLVPQVLVLQLLVPRLLEPQLELPLILVPQLFMLVQLQQQLLPLFLIPLFVLLQIVYKHILVMLFQLQSLHVHHRSCLVQVNSLIFLVFFC